MNKRVKIPCQQKLNELFDYDPSTGYLFDAGTSKRADYKHGRGYRCVYIKDRAYMAHRVIWKMKRGVVPEYLDHINMDKSDNRMENIRAASSKINSLNRNAQSNNRLGIQGVHFSKAKNGYIAQTTINGKPKHLKLSKCPALCGIIYMVAKNKRIKEALKEAK